MKKKLEVDKLSGPLLREYEIRKEEIRRRLEEFRKVPPDRYFYELAYCLMTPQSSALHADAVQRKLEELRFAENDFNPEEYLGCKQSYIRFHRTKSRLLLLMKSQYPEIERILSSPIPAFDLRERLVETVRGFGYKESTHFLRNIGRNDGLAILDRHIVRNLAKYGVIRSVPDSLPRKRYLALEEKFQQFSGSVGIPIDELDLLFWSQETGRILK